MIWRNPIFLFLAPILITIVIYFLYKNRLSFKFPWLKMLSTKGQQTDNRIIPKHLLIYYLPIFCLALAILFLCLALARPQQILKSSKSKVDGIGIMLVFDMSGSMAAEDFKPKDRFHVAQNVLSDFASRRVNDLLGVVVFGTDAFLLSPLTNNKELIKNQINKLKLGQIEGKTAIGQAISKAVNHLRDVKVKSKIIILLTDGENNSGDIDPLTAANLASAMDIKIYTIGIGKIGGAPVPFIEPYSGRKLYYREHDGSLALTKLDETSLKEIAKIAGGIYFRATDADSLKQIYKHIDKLEKTEVETKTLTKYKDKYQSFLYLGILFYLLFLLGDYVILKTVR